MSINGAKVVSGKLPESNELDFSGLRSGIYILILVNEETRETARHKVLLK